MVDIRLAFGVPAASPEGARRRSDQCETYIEIIRQTKRPNDLKIEELYATLKKVGKSDELWCNWPFLGQKTQFVADRSQCM